MYLQKWHNSCSNRIFYGTDIGICVGSQIITHANELNFEY